MTRTRIKVLASFSILANGVIDGTDVFGAIILRPAVAGDDERTLTQRSTTSTASAIAAS